MRALLTIPRPRRRPFFLALLLACSACAPPLQSGGVEVRAGVAERLGAVCRFRLGDASGGGLCGEEEAPEDEDEPLAPLDPTPIAGPAEARISPVEADRFYLTPVLKTAALRRDGSAAAPVLGGDPAKAPPRREDAPAGSTLTATVNPRPHTWTKAFPAPEPLRRRKTCEIENLMRDAGSRSSSEAYRPSWGVTARDTRHE